MRHLLRNSIFVIAILVLAIGSIIPPEKQLRLGKDLRGGTTLVYSVNIASGENAKEVLDKTISVLKNRVDPNGVFEIQMVAQGQDRIEITMPLPSDRVIELREAFEAELEKLESSAVDPGELERTMRLSEDERAAEIERMAGGDAEKRAALVEAARMFDAASVLRDEFSRLESEDNIPDETLDEIAAAVATAELDYEEARDAVLATGLDPQRVRRALQLSEETKMLRNADGEMVPSASPKEREFARIRESYPDQVEQFDAIVAEWETYTAERTSLDDTEDLKRLIQAAGVPAFRITVDPQGGSSTGNSTADEQRLRDELLEKGPRNVRSPDTRWCRINKIENWYESEAELALLESNPAAFFAGRGYVGERYEGDYYMLCWDAPGKRLTQADGDWSVARSFQSTDQVGRPAIGFEMDTRGARKLGDLTGPNIGNKMAVLLDEEVYTAPVLQGNISRNGQITGEFTNEELNYIIRVLTAGSLQAKLSPEPLSQNTIAPEFGADNLTAGAYAGIAALVAVSVFMIIYYFMFGGVAVVCLFFNAMLILGAMALARAAFTLPGIAGVILTFGMAVDANVLIYERIREETRAGADLRTAVRLGYQKALSSIVDGNVTNLIVTFVLANLGTQEIRGFAITLGIGVVCTMFSALVVSRVIISLFVDVAKFKRMRMLPTVIPVIERVLEPKINWMGLRWAFVVISTIYVGIGIAMIAIQGEKMLDTEFRGGTQVTLTLREGNDGETGVNEAGNITLTRADVIDRVHAIGDGLEQGDPLRPLRDAEVIPINPEADGVTSDRFQIKTLATVPDQVVGAIVGALEGLVESKPPLQFRGQGVVEPSPADDLVYPILGPRLGESIGRTEVRNDVTPFIGGVAIVLDFQGSAPTVDGLRERIRNMRESAQFSDTLSRTKEIVILEGNSGEVRSAAILVLDPGAGYLLNRDQWEEDVATREWQLVRAALTETTVLASVQSFSPVIAENFQQTAIVAVVLSLLLILIYIWVRFGSARYSAAAIVCLLHDVMTCIGLIALAEIVYDNAALQPIAIALNIEPFKIDLTLVAAILTIIGYSLNDTIIIMDRIRENRGKLPYATREVINLSINQTISRTVITSGTTLLATLILYIYGGPGVRAFSYALLIGVLVGTYSSIAVAAPLVWSRKKSAHAEPIGTAADGRLP